MRPVSRGVCPIGGVDFANFQDAKLYLVSRLGPYCSYCERRIQSMLAVEHIQPKGLPAYAHLCRRWENFLLSCVNCNSAKLNKDVVLANILLPDRDNTFGALIYAKDGTVKPSPALRPELRKKARAILSLTGLDKKVSSAKDENGKIVALDRVAQRLEAWAIAEEAAIDLRSNPSNEAVRRGTVRTAKAVGFFSIWMAAFEDDFDMLNRLVDAFEGTRSSGCFDGVGKPIRSPNSDLLPHGGKV